MCAVRVSQTHYWPAERGSYALHIAEWLAAAYHVAVCVDRRYSPGLSRVSSYAEELLDTVLWSIQQICGLGLDSDIRLSGKLAVREHA